MENDNQENFTERMREAYKFIEEKLSFVPKN